MTKNQQHKERGGWLTAWLIIIALHGVLATYLVFNALKQEYAPSKPLIITSLIFISTASVIAAIAIWYWKKWGLYLYAATIIIGMATHIVMTGSLLFVFFDIIPLAILGYLLNAHNKWRYFESTKD